MPLNIQGSSRLLLRLRARACILAGRADAAESAFTQLLLHWPDDAHALASRAHLRAQAGRRGAAIGDAQALVDAWPRRRAADWFNLAFLLEADGQLQRAEAAFRSALALDDRLDRAWYGLGLTLIQLQRSDEAVVALRRNTELQPMSPYGWYQLARLHCTRNETDEALRIVRRLQGFEPRIAAQLQRETGLAA